MTRSEALLIAGKTISDHDRWCQREYATTRLGISCQPRARGAWRFSAYGVMYHVYRVNLDDFNRSGLDQVAVTSALLDLCASHLFRATLSQVNDELGHAETLEVFRRAIRQQRATEAHEREKYRGAA